MSSSIYSGTIAVSASTTLKYFSTDVAGNSEAIKTSVYTINLPSDTTPPVTTASPSGGTYTGSQTVTLTCSDGTGSGCDKIYFTIDGSTPTTASNIYTAPLVIVSTTTLKYFANDLAGNAEAVKTQTYTINGGGSVYTDNFDRANASPIGSPWVTVTGLGNLQLLNNQVTAQYGGFSAAYYNAQFSDDQFSQITIDALNDQYSLPAPMVRVSTSEQTYY
jgi:hypothetical protein